MPRVYDYVVQPIPGLEAFRREGAAAVQSQAAFLLLLGQRIALDLPADVSEASGHEADDENALELPLVPRLKARLQHASVLEALGKTRPDFGKLRSTQSRRERAAIAVALLGGLADSLYKTRTADAAAELMEVCLFHPAPLVRAAAAAARLDLLTERWSSVAVLEQSAAQEDDAMARKVAKVALARAFRDAPVPMADETRLPRQAAPLYSVIVHGTFAQNDSWWQPGEPLHSYLSANGSPNLYTGNSPFSWSGAYSATARRLGAARLADWANTHSGGALAHVFAHSHGGSVAMVASQGGLGSIAKLVLLSCPVHQRYSPNFAVVADTVSVRVKLDLVILADGGRQRFRDPRIRQIVLPIWFNHFASRDPAVWQTHNIAARI